MSLFDGCLHPSRRQLFVVYSCTRSAARARALSLSSSRRCAPGGLGAGRAHSSAARPPARLRLPRVLGSRRGGAGRSDGEEGGRRKCRDRRAICSSRRTSWRPARSRGSPRCASRRVSRASRVAPARERAPAALHRLRSFVPRVLPSRRLAIRARSNDAPTRTSAHYYRGADRRSPPGPPLPRPRPGGRRERQQVRLRVHARHLRLQRRGRLAHQGAPSLPPDPAPAPANGETRARAPTPRRIARGFGVRRIILPEHSARGDSSRLAFFPRPLTLVPRPRTPSASPPPLPAPTDRGDAEPHDHLLRVAPEEPRPARGVHQRRRHPRVRRRDGRGEAAPEVLRVRREARGVAPAPGDGADVRGEGGTVQVRPGEDDAVAAGVFAQARHHGFRAPPE